MEDLWTDEEVVARTVYGEARGEKKKGKIAVAWVIRNRVEKPRWWGWTYREVCLKPYQFSCWNPGDPNREKCLAVMWYDPTYQACLEAAVEVMNGEVDDPTDGATSYVASYIPLPEWTSRMALTKRIGNHVFFREA